jgi:hypothetical protein
MNIVTELVVFALSVAIAFAAVAILQKVLQ